MTKFMLNAGETAEMLNLSKQRVWAMARDGLFPPGVIVRLGRQIRFERENLTAWVRAGGTISDGAGFEYEDGAEITTTILKGEAIYEGRECQ